MHRLFKDSPARRSIFKELTGCVLFPKKFCAIRWVENAIVLERALTVWPHVCKFVLEVTPKPTSEAFYGVQVASSDKCVVAKMEFIRSCATLVEPFLRKFQSSQPMAPFLYQELYDILLAILRRFVKQSVLNKTSLQKMKDLDLSDVSGNLLPMKEVDVGIGASVALKKHNITESQRVSFFTDCRQFLRAMTKKLFERCPVQYPLVRGVSSLSPKFALDNVELSIKRFTMVLELLCKVGRVESTAADKAKTQYCQLLNSEAFQTSAFTFSASNRLDNFYAVLLNDKVLSTFLPNISVFMSFVTVHFRMNSRTYGA